jgi:SPP1 gp7 family putative phage head morphogenesis protein
MALFRNFTLDATKKNKVKGKFKPSPTAEREFYRSLRKIAAASSHIVERHVAGHQLVDEPRMQQALRDYAETLTPWARRQAQKMLLKVQASNSRAFRAKAVHIGSELKKALADDTDLGIVTRKLLNEHVALIKSIPLEAGLRAQRLALEAALIGQRADVTAGQLQELAEQLGQTGQVTASRALLIARTETAKANAAINQARAQKYGSTGYTWHNSGDGAVRPSHLRLKGRPLQGQFFRWDAPPTLDDGMTGHPGEFPNCRCFAEPYFEDE